MNKKGQAQIISTVLIILLVLAAVVIVWTIVEGFTKGAASIVEDSDICFKINLEILEANAESGAIVNDGSLVIKRGVGAGDLKKIAVVIGGVRGSDIDASGLDELGQITPSNLDLPDGSEVEIYAIVGTSNHLCENVEDNAVAS